MVFSLNRNHVFLVLILLILTFLFINRISFIIGSKITDGEVVDFNSWQSSGKYRTTHYAPVVEYKTDNGIYQFTACTDDYKFFKLGEKVKVIYKFNHENAKIYSLLGFGFPITQMPLLIVLLIAVFSSVYSFIDSKQRILINIGKKPSFKRTEIDYKLEE